MGDPDLLVLKQWKSILNNTAWPKALLKIMTSGAWSLFLTRPQGSGIILYMSQFKTFTYIHINTARQPKVDFLHSWQWFCPKFWVIRLYNSKET